MSGKPLKMKELIEVKFKEIQDEKGPDKTAKKRSLVSMKFTELSFPFNK